MSLFTAAATCGVGIYLSVRQQSVLTNNYYDLLKQKTDAQDARINLFRSHRLSSQTNTTCGDLYDGKIYEYLGITQFELTNRKKSDLTFSSDSSCQELSRWWQNNFDVDTWNYQYHCSQLSSYIPCIALQICSEAVLKVCDDDYPSMPFITEIIAAFAVSTVLLLSFLPLDYWQKYIERGVLFFTEGLNKADLAFIKDTFQDCNLVFNNDDNIYKLHEKAECANSILLNNNILKQAAFVMAVKNEDSPANLLFNDEIAETKLLTEIFELADIKTLTPRNNQ